MNLCSPREENPDRRASTTRTAQSADGARAWSELFVQSILQQGTTSEHPSSPRFAAVESDGVGEQSVGVGDQSVGVGVQFVGVGDQSADVGVQTASVGDQSAGVGVQTVGVGVQSTSVAGPSNACLQKSIMMARLKEKLPKFNGDGTTDLI